MRIIARLINYSDNNNFIAITTNYHNIDPNPVVA